MLADVRCERAGELAVVELAGASLGDSLERPGQIGHGDPVARDEALTSALVDAAALGGVAQDHVEDRVQVGLRARELDAVAGKLDRGRDQLRPRQRAVRAVRRLEAGGHTGDGSGRRADVEHLLRRAVEVDVDLLHLPALARRRPKARHRDEEVEEPRAPVARPVDEHETAATGTRERALGDPGGEGGGDARVDGVPARGEHARARLGGHGMAGGDRSSHESQA